MTFNTQRMQTLTRSPPNSGSGLHTRHFLQCCWFCLAINVFALVTLPDLLICYHQQSTVRACLFVLGRFSLSLLTCGGSMSDVHQDACPRKGPQRVAKGASRCWGRGVPELRAQRASSADWGGKQKSLGSTGDT